MLQSCCRLAPRLLPRRCRPLWRAHSLPAVAPPLATTFPYGLTGATATEAHYSTALDLALPLLLRSSSRDFMAAAREDAGSERVEGYLARASSACDAFLDSEVVHGREEVRRELLGVLRQRGQLALLLGGASVGKSLLLRELARAPTVGKDGVLRVVVLVNGRGSGADLAGGVVRALQKVTLEGALGGALQGAGRSAADCERHTQVLEGLREAVKVAAPALFSGLHLTPGAADTERMLDAMCDLARREGAYVCLVIDEGNLALPSPPQPGEALGEGASSSEQQRQLRDTKSLLNRLVMLTKESRRMNVLIATSEHAYPYRLQHGNFFNTTNLTRTILAGELPPARMRELLRSWGLGPRTSDVFLAYLGGHVHLASQALDRLAATLDAFDVLEVAPSLCAVSVDTCLREGGSSARGLLRALAQAGWAPVEGPQEAAVQVLARENVGGLVDQSAVVVGLPAALRRSAAGGLGAVPSFHFLRHVIAHRLSVADRLQGLASP